MLASRRVMCRFWGKGHFSLLCAFLLWSVWFTAMQISPCGRCTGSGAKSLAHYSGGQRTTETVAGGRAQAENVHPVLTSTTEFIPIVDNTLTFPRSYTRVSKCPSRNETVCKLLTYRVPSESQRHALLDLLHVIDNVSSKMNWTYFITSGTLLGSWRHHGLIPWDRDADVFMDLSQRDELLRVFSGSDYTPKKMFQPSHLLKFYNIYANVLLQSVGRMRWPYIDIYFYTGNETHVWDIDPWRRSEFTVPRSDIFPLHKRPFERMDLYAPKESLKLLQQIYGSNGICKSRYASVQCSELDGLVPFVHRQFVNGTMEEKLMYGTKILSIKFVEENSDDVTHPFTLIRN